MFLIRDARKALFTLLLYQVKKRPVGTEFEEEVYLKAIELPVLLAVDKLYNVVAPLNAFEDF